MVSTDVKRGSRDEQIEGESDLSRRKEYVLCVRPLGCE